MYTMESQKIGLFRTASAADGMYSSIDLSLDKCLHGLNKSVCVDALHMLSVLVHLRLVRQLCNPHQRTVRGIT
jgi:hypothetical protein